MAPVEAMSGGNVMMLLPDIPSRTQLCVLIAAALIERFVLLRRTPYRRLRILWLVGAFFLTAEIGWELGLTGCTDVPPSYLHRLGIADQIPNIMWTALLATLDYLLVGSWSLYRRDFGQRVSCDAGSE